ncbi:hypothetical protein K435DRAFT_860463 [Dendrothele bispora CBS 962.96]|uniref:2OGFeDO JBP1/TET oxygenase domain-containing protein n=1 Tax=Dendrothele bispora (strain CBS 962.96) TaxID=1314807 RepID=A0A4S8LZ22_DENBC|nr:hypothetical protein K435DRAFT_860463 [Dendrothele bispora CBS 962.96]
MTSKGTKRSAETSVDDHRYGVRSKGRFIQVDSEGSDGDELATLESPTNPVNIFQTEEMIDAVNTLRLCLSGNMECQNLKPVQGVNLARLGNALRNAVVHKVVLPIKASSYFSLSIEQRHKQLDRWRSEKAQPRLFSDKTVFVDEEGIALLWYLPNLLDHEVKHQVYRSTSLIDRKLVEGVQKHSSMNNAVSKKHKGWRSDHELFSESRPKQHVRQGVANFSFGWRGSGREWTDDDIASSLSLRGNNSDVLSAQQWLRRISTLQLTVSLALSAIHPDLFEAGRDVLEYCSRPDSHKGRTSEWASRWNSVFSALTVICDRRTPAHIDSHGCPNYVDALVSLGTASTPTLFFRELNAKFSYKSGTVVFFSGRGWTHEVGDWGAGQRVCYASYIRPEIIEAHRSSVTGWGIRV